MFEGFFSILVCYIKSMVYLILTCKTFIFSFKLASKRIFVNLLNPGVLTKLVDLIKQNLFLIYVAYFYVLMGSLTLKLGSLSLCPTSYLIDLLVITSCWLHFHFFLKIVAVFVKYFIQLVNIHIFDTAVIYL